MKRLNVLETKSTLQSCALEVRKNLYDQEFFQLNSNLNLNSTFKTPNVRSYDLLEKDFYTAVCTEDMFNQKKFICLINEMVVEEETVFSKLLSTLGLSQTFNATLMENLVNFFSIKPTKS